MAMIYGVGGALCLFAAAMPIQPTERWSSGAVVVARGDVLVAALSDLSATEATAVSRRSTDDAVHAPRRHVAAAPPRARLTARLL